jgi:transcriptional regulator with XRE-family HTH domain
MAESRRTADQVSISRQVGKNIQRKRWDLGWTQGQLATKIRALGLPMSQQSLSQIENGKDGAHYRSVSVEELMAFAFVFEIAVTDLLFGPQKRTVAVSFTSNWTKGHYSRIVGRNVKRYREKLKLSERQVADAMSQLGMQMKDVQNLKRIEQGYHNFGSPSTVSVDQLAAFSSKEVLNVNPEDLLVEV